MKREYVISGTTVLAAAAVAVALFFTKNAGSNNILNLDTKAEDNAPVTDPAKTASAAVNASEQTLNLGTGALAGTEMPQLQVAEILVSAGEAVRSGTPLIRLTADSVKNARTALQKEILDASKTYDLLEAGQRQLRLQVSQTHDNYITDGKYAGTVYSDQCDALQKKTAAAKETVDDTQNQVNQNLLELTRLWQELADARQYLREAETAVSENYPDRYKNAYYYTVYENTRETAQNMVNQLEEQIEQRTGKNEALLYEVDEAVRTYHQTVLESEKEKLAAKMDYETALYYSEAAAQWRDIQTARLDNALQEAGERYGAALQNIRDFDAHIVRNRILSKRGGIVSDIMVAPGDSVMQNDTLVIFAPPAQTSP